MKNTPLLITLPLIGIGIFTLINKTRQPVVSVQDASNIAICGAPSIGNFGTNEAGKFIGAMPGWGDYSYKISTKTDSAQFYFNQGLSMYYGYHMKEALASFKEASRIDPSSAMSYWGQALTMGPYYNAAHTYAMPEAIIQVLKQMNETNTASTAKEKDLFEVMNLRYSDDLSDSKRKELNQTYAAEMRKMISKYPDDLDIKILYVDAMMLIHAWDFWNQDGSAKEWTPELVSLSEQVLKKNPEHPAALHYHIHLTEASRNPEVALPNADKLKNNLPGVAHMVHMASHEYQRNGLYAKGVEVNDLADAQLGLYDSLAKNLSLVKHSPHYFAVQTYCAMSGGMYKTGIQNALRVRKVVAPTAENTYDQYLFMMPVLTRVRLGKWEEILKDNVEPDEKWAYARLLHHFAKGMAYVNTGNSGLAKEELIQLRSKIKDTILEKRRIPFNATLPVAQVADGILDAAISFSLKDYDLAIKSLEKAIQIEDKLIYTEPNDWPIPARQFLGAYYLKMGKAELAAKTYKEDIKLNPGNGWSYLGLYQSAEKQKDKSQLAAYKAKYLTAFSHADEIPPGSVYLQ